MVLLKLLQVNAPKSARKQFHRILRCLFTLKLFHFLEAQFWLD